MQKWPFGPSTQRAFPISNTFHLNRFVFLLVQTCSWPTWVITCGIGHTSSWHGQLITLLGLSTAINSTWLIGRWCTTYFVECQNYFNCGHVSRSQTSPQQMQTSISETNQLVPPCAQVVCRSRRCVPMFCSVVMLEGSKLWCTPSTLWMTGWQAPILNPLYRSASLSMLAVEVGSQWQRFVRAWESYTHWWWLTKIALGGGSSWKGWFVKWMVEFRMCTCW